MREIGELVRLAFIAEGDRIQTTLTHRQGYVYMRGHINTLIKFDDNRELKPVRSDLVVHNLGG